MATNEWRSFVHGNHEQCVRATRTRSDGTDTRPAPAARIRDWLRACLGRARSRARLRRELERLDTHLLHDIGGRREDLVREAYRPFWRA